MGGGGGGVLRATADFDVMIVRDKAAATITICALFL